MTEVVKDTMAVECAKLKEYHKIGARTESETRHDSEIQYETWPCRYWRQWVATNTAVARMEVRAQGRGADERQVSVRQEVGTA